MKKSIVPDGPPFSPTLPNLVRDAARRHGAREYMVMGDRRITFEETESISADWAQGLLALGVGKGTRVGLLMANDPAQIGVFRKIKIRRSLRRKPRHGPLEPFEIVVVQIMSRDKQRIEIVVTNAP